jgi:hypothetical protein
MKQPAGTVPEALKHRVAPLRRRIGDRMRHRACEAPQMAVHGFRRLDHRAESCVGDGAGPVVVEPHRSRHIPAAPDAPEVLLVGRCSGRLHILPQQPVGFLRFVASGVSVRSEPLMLRSLECIVCEAGRSCLLLTPNRVGCLVEEAGSLERLGDSDRHRLHLQKPGRPHHLIAGPSACAGPAGLGCCGGFAWHD